MSRLAVVVVHYRTPELAVEAVEAARRDGRESGLEIEVVLIDNGNDERGRALLEGLACERIEPGENLGYAGGVNLGVARTRAERIVLMNPDVRVLPGCLGALARTLDSGAAVVGPQFYWDEKRRMVLPPSEERGRVAEMLALLATSGERWTARARRRWRRHARRHWEAREPLRSYALSGSLLALSRAAWERVGPFDPGYRLYFEETDWLRRAERLGLPALYVPAARAIHHHARSAVQEPQAERWFEESAARFRERHYGRAFRRLLALTARRLSPAAPARLPRLPPEGLPLAGRGFPLWIEVSPNATGYPAAAERLDGPPQGGWRLPESIAARLAGAQLTLQLVEARGRELERYAVLV